MSRKPPAGPVRAKTAPKAEEDRLADLCAGLAAAAPRGARKDWLGCEAQLVEAARMSGLEQLVAPLVEAVRARARKSK